MAVIHMALLVPIMGSSSMGTSSAAMIPVTIMAATWLNTATAPRWVVFRVDRGTIRLWDIL